MDKDLPMIIKSRMQHMASITTKTFFTGGIGRLVNCYTIYVENWDD
jgi:hypothetical protein